MAESATEPSLSQVQQDPPSAEDESEFSLVDEAGLQAIKEDEQPLDEYSYTQRENFTSEISKIEICNLPFRITTKDLKKLLIRLKVDPHKIKLFTIGKQRFAFVTFKNEELRDGALKILDGYEHKKNKLRAQLAKPRADPVQKAKQQSDIVDNELDEKSILDIVTPFHNIPYEEQLVKKQTAINELLTKLGSTIQRSQREDYNFVVRNLKRLNGRSTICKIEDIRASPVIDGYRNKNEFTPGRDEDGQVVVGFRKSSYRKGSVTVGRVTAEMKHIPPLAVEVAHLFETYFQKIAETRPPYSAVTETGHWRQLTVRTSETKQCMVLVLFHPQNLTAEEIQAEHAALTEFHETSLKHVVSSLHFQLSDKKGNTYQIEHLAGAPVIEEVLLGLTFEISPPSFFQINTKCAEVLYQQIFEIGGFNENTTVLDMFCGTGSIGLTMASKVKKVVGAEVVVEAVLDAQKVAKKHNITNCSFIAGKAEDVLSLALHQVNGEKEVIVIIDPPRQGVHNRVIKLLRGNPIIDKIVYVACNPAAAQQNVVDFSRPASNAYRGDPFVLVEARPVDMFPHTPHTELIMLLKRSQTVKADIDALEMKTIDEA